MALENAISPAMVGVDIGCGMCAVNTGLPLEAVQPKLHDIRLGMMAAIPVGFSHRATPFDIPNDLEILWPGKLQVEGLESESPT